MLTFLRNSGQVFFKDAPRSPPWGLAVGGWGWVKKPFTVALLDRV
jgi:hypothetical protein